MKLFPATERREEAGDPKNFTGSVTVSRINEVCDEPLVNLYRVVFQPRARTVWHIHTGPQLLLVLEGCCRLQKKGRAISRNLCWRYGSFFAWRKTLAWCCS